MRIKLRGINSKRKKLADGSFKTYYWAWKGGPPLIGEPGSPEFVASYNAAVATKVTPPRGRLLSVLHDYQKSDEFLSLAPRSRLDYVGKIKLIEKEFGDFPLSGMTDKRTRGIFKAWRERVALSSRRQADYAWTVLARVLSFGLDRGLVAANPCERGGRLYRGSRSAKSGPMLTKPHSLNVRQHTCICRCCSHCGPDNGRATCCGCRGRLMTASIFACVNRRAAPAW